MRYKVANHFDDPDVRNLVMSLFVADGRWTRGTKQTLNHE